MERPIESRVRHCFISCVCQLYLINCVVFFNSKNICREQNKALAVAEITIVMLSKTERLCCMAYTDNKNNISTNVN